MDKKLPPILIEEFRKYLLHTFGLNFMEKRDSDLLRNIEQAAKEFSFSDNYEFITWLLENKITEQELGTLASYFTIGETYFLREKKSFDFLEHIYLPGLIFKRKSEHRTLRVWSAGCASGEEAYTIAVLLKRVIPDIKNWDITILATDINPVFLEKARRGIYTKWSFRNNPDWFLDNYFTKTGKNEYQILPEIRKMVTFSSLNLAENSYPSQKTNTESLDIIFCRNVLIYFNQKGHGDVTSRFYKSLKNGGLLMVSPVEMSSWISPEFEKIFYSGFTIYQKGSIKGSKPIVQKTEWIVTQKEKIPVVSATLTTKVPGTTPSVFKQTIEIPKEKSKPEVLKPEVPDFKKAIELFEQADFEKAENILTVLKTTAIEKLPVVIQLLAKTKANLGKLNEAAILCDEALTTDKTNENLHYLKATISQELGNDEAALASLNRAIYMNQNFVLAHFLSGNICLKMGKKTNGMNHFKNATTILSKMGKDEILPESDGITVERFKEIINSIKN